MKSRGQTFFLLSFLLVASCGGPDVEGIQKTTLSFGVVAGDDGLGKRHAGHVTIDTAKLLIKHIVLMPQDAVSYPDFKTGPYVVQLTDALQTITVGDIFPGTYDEARFEIHKPDQNETPPDPDFRDGSQGNQRYSLVIIGHYQGNRFVFKSKNTINQTLPLDPVLIADETVTETHVSVRVNRSGWFMNGAQELNPTDTRPNNIAAIENSLRASFRAFVDPDRDGE